MTCRKTRFKTWLDERGALLLSRVACCGRLDDDGRCGECGGVRWRRDRPGAPIEKVAPRQARLWR